MSRDSILSLGMPLTWPFVFQNSENADSNACLPKVTIHGTHNWASMSAPFLWRKQLVASFERSDISCHASCPHLWLFAVSPFHAFSCPSYLTPEHLSLHLPYMQVPITNLRKSEVNQGFCLLPSHVKSQKPGGILAKPTLLPVLLLS